jgi:hypothetical protein
LLPRIRDHKISNSRWRHIVQEGDDFFPCAIGVHSVGPRALPPLRRWLHSVKNDVIDRSEVSSKVSKVIPLSRPASGPHRIWPLKTALYFPNNVRSEQWSCVSGNDPRYSRYKNSGAETLHDLHNNLRGYTTPLLARRYICQPRAAPSKSEWTRHVQFLNSFCTGLILKALRLIWADWMSGSLFRFDTFELDRENLQLRSSGQCVRLQKGSTGTVVVIGGQRRTTSDPVRDYREDLG